MCSWPPLPARSAGPPSWRHRGDSPLPLQVHPLARRPRRSELPRLRLSASPSRAPAHTRAPGPWSPAKGQPTASAGNRTRANCLEGSCAHRSTTNARGRAPGTPTRTRTSAGSPPRRTPARTTPQLCAVAGATHGLHAPHLRQSDQLGRRCRCRAAPGPSAPRRGCPGHARSSPSSPAKALPQRCRPGHCAAALTGHSPASRPGGWGQVPGCPEVPPAILGRPDGRLGLGDPSEQVRGTSRRALGSERLDRGRHQRPKNVHVSPRRGIEPRSPA